MENDETARLGPAVQAKDSKAALAAKALAFDPERYRHHIAHLNMSEEAQTELMAVVWRMMQSFVDLGFGEDATQLARIAGDKQSAGREAVGTGTLGCGYADRANERPLAGAFRASGSGDWKERSVPNAAD